MQTIAENYSFQRISKFISRSKQYNTNSDFINLSWDNRDGEEKIKVKAEVKNSLAERLESEITTFSKMKEYEDIANKQKEDLFKENKRMRVKFSEGVQEAKNLERKISGISNMISEFLQILQSQSESVLDIHSNSKEATTQVKQTEGELKLTIDRTKSTTNMLISIILVFTLLLLLIDFFSP